MAIFKYPSTNFEQLNIDFLLETTATNKKNIAQLREDLTAETSAREAADTQLQANIDTVDQRVSDLADTEREDINDLIESLNSEVRSREAADTAEETARIAADDALDQRISDLADTERDDYNALVNTINTEVDARVALDARVEALEDDKPMIFHLSYTQGVLDCTADEANSISKAFDEDIRCMVVFMPSGEEYERTLIHSYTGGKKAVFSSISISNYNNIDGRTIVLEWVESGDTHTFTSKSCSLNNASKIFDMSCNQNTPNSSATITYAGDRDDLWAYMLAFTTNTQVFIRLTTTNTSAPEWIFSRIGKYQVNVGDLEEHIVFACPKNGHYYMIDVGLSQPDPTDPTTWTVSIHAADELFS